MSRYWNDLFRYSRFESSIYRRMTNLHAMPSIRCSWPLQKESGKKAWKSITDCIPEVFHLSWGAGPAEFHGSPSMRLASFRHPENSITCTCKVYVILTWNEDKMLDKCIVWWLSCCPQGLRLFQIRLRQHCCFEPAAPGRIAGGHNCASKLSVFFSCAVYVDVQWKYGIDVISISGKIQVTPHWPFSCG